MTKIERFFANLKEKKVAFIGTGVTNNDIIRLFLKKRDFDYPVRPENTGKTWCNL